MKYERAILDGSRITELTSNDEELTAVAEKVFDELDEDKDGKLTKGELRPAIFGLGEEMGVPGPGTAEEAELQLSAAFKSIDIDHNGSVSKDEFKLALKEILDDIAATLKSRPVAVEYTEFDGELIRELLADETALGQLCTKMFADLDTDRSGALSRAEMKPMIVDLGEDVGLPPGDQQQALELYDRIFEAGDVDRSGEIDIAEFTGTVTALLAAIAENLKEKPIKVTKMVTNDVQVFDGSELTMFIEGEHDKLKEICDTRFEELDTDKSGSLDQKELRPFVEGLTDMAGIPPSDDSRTASLYEEIFQELDENKDNTVSKDEFLAGVTEVLKGMADALKEAPILIFSSEEVDIVQRGGEE